MQPRRAIIALAILAVIGTGVAIASSPNSYAHKFITGQCFKDPAPLACHPRSVGSAGPAGAMH